MFDVTIGNTPICVMADPGATVNIINEQEYLKMKPKPVLLSCTARGYSYMSSKPLELCGKFQSDVTNKQDTCNGTFYVVKGSSRSLLSWETSHRLKLIQVTNVVEEKEIRQIEHYVTSIAPKPVDVATADKRDDTSETEHHVALIARNAVPKAMPLNEVEIATKGVWQMAPTAVRCISRRTV